MLPGTTEEWVLSVKMYLWLGEVFTTTCLEERKNSILLQYIPTMIFHHSQCCENSQETSQLVSGPIKPKTKALDLHHEAGTQQSLSDMTWSRSPAARHCTNNYYLHSPPQQPFTSAIALHKRERTKRQAQRPRLLYLKINPGFTSQASNTKASIFYPHRSSIPQLWFQQEMDAKPKQGSQCIV